MFGFIDRLLSWLEQAAADELDPVGEPLHPPVAYPSADIKECIVIKADAPAVQPPAWFGLGHLRVRSPERLDLEGWTELFLETKASRVAAAMLLSERMPFEFPTTLQELLTVMEQRGVPKQSVMLTLRAAAIHDPRGTALYVIIGTPMRGVSGNPQMRQHLSVWCIDPTFADALRNSLHEYSSNQALREIGQEIMRILWDWTSVAKVNWCTVYEDRPEVTERRDRASALSVLKGLRVSVWGCGALGSHIAEWLTRAGIASIVLRDNGKVAPGVLVRQSFEDQDVHKYKVDALAARLERVRPDLKIEPHAEDLLSTSLCDGDWSDGADVVIDTTGSNSILGKLERRLRDDPRNTVLASMAIDATASMGLVATAPPFSTAGLSDTLRRAKLAACGRDALKGFADAFWPDKARDHFFPEPGCSSPTFVGSAADVVSLAALMLNAIAQDVAMGEHRARAHFLSASRRNGEARTALAFSNQVSLRDPNAGYEIRIGPSAWCDIHGWIAASRRRFGPRFETGGILFGELDAATKTIWVDEVLGPPPDSTASVKHFDCGVKGVQEAAAEKRVRSRASLKCVGLWHTHPHGLPVPSDIDFDGMWSVIRSAEPRRTSALLLIIGGDEAAPLALAQLFQSSGARRGQGGFELELRSVPPSHSTAAKKSIALALSGGGSRAIAFHLGCLRALKDLGLLDRVNVISSVSGGSVIAALYAYSRGSFEDFDERVQTLLRRGLTRGIIRRWLLSSRLPAAIASALVASVSILAFSCWKWLLRKSGISVDLSMEVPPLRRWVTRTTALEATLRAEYFGNQRVVEPRRNDVEVVFNACELRTGSAFRFGSAMSWCSRYGRLAGESVMVAKAVAASAAYPALLPALDERFRYEGHRSREAGMVRTVLTDGGVFDNLGLSCLEPGRDEVHSFRVFRPDYIVSCDAGPGLFEGVSIPLFWPRRMTQSFLTLMRKNQDSWRKKLHLYAQTGELEGFVLAYLGQQDDALPYRPADLVPRSAVYKYPTDFSAMKQNNIDRLSARGERLTRLLLERHCPSLLD